MSYGEAGWVHWPAHPEASAQFLRVLGTAQEGGAAVGECFLAASRIDPAEPRSWHAAWQDRARRNQAEARQAWAAGHRDTARANWLRAATYFRASEALLAPSDPLRPAAFEAMLECSQAFLELLLPQGEVLEIAVGDGTVVDAYFVKPPGDGLWPCVVCMSGLDGTKDDLLTRVLRPLLARGFALLLVDMPGQGEALRKRGLPNRPDTEAPVSACIDYLCTRPDVDPRRLALYGASLGGVYAARAAAHERRLKAVVSDSLVFDLHAAFAQRLAMESAQAGRGDWSLPQWVFGCDCAEAVVEKALQFRMCGFVGLIDAPYLIVQGEHDFLGLQTAVDAFEYASAAGVQVELKVFTAQDTGAAHCQCDNPTLGQEFVGDWLRDRLLK